MKNSTEGSTRWWMDQFSDGQRWVLVVRMRRIGLVGEKKRREKKKIKVGWKKK